MENDFLTENLHKPTRYFFLGDQEKARSLVGMAKNILFRYKLMQFSGSVQSVFTKELEDGTIFQFNTAIPGMDIVRINAPPSPAPKPWEKIEEKGQIMPAFDAYDASGNLIGYVVCKSGVWAPEYRFYPLMKDVSGNLKPLDPFGYGQWKQWYNSRPYTDVLKGKLVADEGSLGSPFSEEIDEIACTAENFVIDGYNGDDIPEDDEWGGAPYLDIRYNCANACWEGGLYRQYIFTDKYDEQDFPQVVSGIDGDGNPINPDNVMSQAVDWTSLYIVKKIWDQWSSRCVSGPVPPGCSDPAGCATSLANTIAANPWTYTFAQIQRLGNPGLGTEINYHTGTEQEDQLGENYSSGGGYSSYFNSSAVDSSNLGLFFLNYLGPDTGEEWYVTNFDGCGFPSGAELMRNVTTQNVGWWKEQVLVDNNLYVYKQGVGDYFSEASLNAGIPASAVHTRYFAVSPTVKYCLISVLRKKTLKREYIIVAPNSKFVMQSASFPDSGIVPANGQDYLHEIPGVTYKDQKVYGNGFFRLVQSTINKITGSQDVA